MLPTRRRQTCPGGDSRGVGRSRDLGGGGARAGQAAPGGEDPRGASRGETDLRQRGTMRAREVPVGVISFDAMVGRGGRRRRERHRAAIARVRLGLVGDDSQTMTVLRRIRGLAKVSLIHRQKLGTLIREVPAGRHLWSVGRVERRRVQKLRRRARDRDVARLIADDSPSEEAYRVRRHEARGRWREYVGSTWDWWSTTKGRASWRERDCQEKLSDRAARRTRQ